NTSACKLPVQPGSTLTPILTSCAGSSWVRTIPNVSPGAGGSAKGSLMNPFSPASSAGAKLSSGYSRGVYECAAAGGVFSGAGFLQTSLTPATLSTRTAALDIAHIH